MISRHTYSRTLSCVAGFTALAVGLTLLSLMRGWGQTPTQKAQQNPADVEPKADDLAKATPQVSRPAKIPIVTDKIRYVNSTSTPRQS
jgi:hypothetical protein